MGGRKLPPDFCIPPPADLVHKQVTLTLRLHELNKITVVALPGA
jgi:hypothetical protein